MIIKVLSVSLAGIDAMPVEVEVEVGRGLPSFLIVGMPDTACRESQVRVRSAITASGFRFPSSRITVNLAPAEIKKEGSGFDLAIALAILASTEQIKSDLLQEVVICGELSLDGRVRPVNGMLPRAAAECCRERRFVFPFDNRSEVFCVKSEGLSPVKTLSDAVDEMGRAPQKYPEAADGAGHKKKRHRSSDYLEVRGQFFAKRGIEIACAGGHNLVMVGPPGAGKTMLAKRITTILPDLSRQEAIEATKVHSIAGELKKRDVLIQQPPFRAPHHSISNAALLGGGAHPRPGEVSLAHHGVLFLDELPEFRRDVLEVLRQPLEDRRILVSRAAYTVSYPANFMLIAAMNPCPCGFWGDPRNSCVCNPLQIRSYMAKISGPLLDRIDLHVSIQSLQAHDYEKASEQESSESIARRVLGAREIQSKRFEGSLWSLNAELDGQAVDAHCPLPAEAKKFLFELIEKLGISGRGYHKILKVARTIADLAANETIDLSHVQEAAQFRFLDRQSWM